MKDAQAVLAVGRRVIATEQDGLNTLKTGLGQTFVDAVNMCAGARGRVILVGVGKSGHIARKIASTLASTGTPSLYIHPTEASHGDLGMIANGDVVIILSRSGETRELSDLVTYCKRFSISLIAMTADGASTLGRACDMCLIIPDAPEACEKTRAPTTSTILSLALGDALAVAVLEQRGFTGEDFKRFHPGGKLGAMLRTAGDLMMSGTQMPIVREKTGMRETLTLMSQANLGCVIVVSAVDERLAGIVTDGDIRRLVARGVVADSVDTAMTRNPVTIKADTLASQALALMHEHRITQLVVVDKSGTKPAGILHMHDLLKAGVA